MDQDKLTQEALNEQIVLGSLIINDKIRDLASADLEPEDFIYPNHKCLAHAIMYIHKNGMTMAAETIYDLARKYNPDNFDTEKMDDIVKFEYISIIEQKGREYNINENTYKYYIDRIRYRTLAVDTIYDSLRDFNKVIKNSDSTYEQALEIIDGIKGKFVTSKVGQADEAWSFGDQMDHWDETSRERQKGRNFIPIGYSHIDYFLNHGLAMGKVTVIAGRPSMGKSMFTLNIVDRISTMSNLAALGNIKDGPPISPIILNRPIPVLLFSLEMSGDSVIDRLIAIRTKIPLTDVVRNQPYLTKSEWTSIDGFRVDIKDSPYMYIYDRRGQTLDTIVQKVSRLKAKLKVDEVIVFIDLIGKIVKVGSNGNVTAAYDAVLNRVQDLAQELNVHFCLVHQISRQAEGTSKGRTDRIVDYRPNLNHLKHTGSFEEIADLILLLYRPKYYSMNVIHDICEVEIAKQREGVMKKVANLLFDGTTSSITTTREMLLEQSGNNINYITADDFYGSDKSIYYSELNPKDREDYEDTVSDYD